MKRGKQLFGYITPYRGELKVKEYEIFKAYYCGLCKSLGKEFNQFTRFGLNYDLNFLALLLSSLKADKDKASFEGCIANPLKKKKIIRPNDSLQYTSHISVMLIYFKLLDDWKDEKSIKALIATLPYIVPVRKAKKTLNSKYNIIKTQLDKLTELEKNNCSIIDESADAFGKLMEEIAVPPFITDENTQRILKWLGYNLGRWIYIIDAFNDIEEDIKKNNYNPMLLQYDYKATESPSDFYKRIGKEVEFTLTFTLENIAKSFELLNIKNNRSILDNIIYMGARRKMDEILNKREVMKHEKSI